MKNTKISRRSFLLGLAACSAAGVLTACSGSFHRPGTPCFLGCQ